MSDLLLLIIDDDLEDQEMFIDAVNELEGDTTCITASDGQDAMEKLNEMKTYPHFIFLDLNMPRLNGKQCLEKLKAIKPLQHIPVVIYSTSKLQSDIEETKALGASYFVTKPTRFDDIKSIIQYIISGNVTDTKGVENLLLVL